MTLIDIFNLNICYIEKIFEWKLEFREADDIDRPTVAKFVFVYLSDCGLFSDAVLISGIFKVEWRSNWWITKGNGHVWLRLWRNLSTKSALSQTV